MQKRNLFELGSSLNNVAPILSQADMRTPQKHELVFLYEKRRGKPVTIVKPFYIDAKELKELLKKIKKKLGTGGTVVENMLEFQGDNKEKVQSTLENLGFRFRKRKT